MSAFGTGWPASPRLIRLFCVIVPFGLGGFVLHLLMRKKHTEAARYALLGGALVAAVYAVLIGVIWSQLAEGG